MKLHTSLRRAAQLLAVVVALFGLWSCAGAKSVSMGMTRMSLPIDSGDVNVIRIRFDTIKLTPGQNYVLMPVKWSYSLPKPHDFRGFNVHFKVDSSKVTVSQFLTQGTASDAMQATPITNTKDSDIFVILGTHEPDFSNPVLFYVALSVQLNPGEVTKLHWTYAEDPKYFKVDTIALEDGWVALEAPKSASVTSRDTTMQADSSISIPVSISDLSGTGVTKARFIATLDTSALEFVWATSGASSNAKITNAGLSGSTLTVDIASNTSSPLAGDGVLFNLEVKAKHRTDTLCTTLTDPSFTAQNSNAYIGTVSVWPGQICVFGSQPSSVVTDEQARKLDLYPNPASTVVRLGLPSATAGRRVQVFDLLGRLVYTGADCTEWRPAASLPDGRYHLVVEDSDGLRKEADVTLVR